MPSFDPHQQQKRLHQAVSEIIDWPSEELIERLVSEAEVGCSDDGRFAEPFRGGPQRRRTFSQTRI